MTRSVPRPDAGRVALRARFATRAAGFGLLAACLLLTPHANATDLAGLGDEFNDASSLSAWTRYDQAFGWPDKIRKVDIDTTARGALHLQPYHSAWVRDLNAPFLFKNVAGDFDVRARLRVRGNKTASPTDIWALGGLFARNPSRIDAAHWQSRRENWLFITTGIGDRPGEVMTETKLTVNSESSLKLRPFGSGWVELRLVRVGTAFIALARADGAGPWQVRDRFHRMMAPPEMQLGLVAYTTSNAAPPGPENPEVINREVRKDLPTDMVLEVDWVRFRQPQVSYPSDWYTGVSANRLTDSALSDKELLALLGD